MSKFTAHSALRMIAMAGVYGGLLMPLVFIPIVIFPFVFSKLIAFQVLIGLTFPAYLILAWMDPAYRPKKHPLMLAILAYFVAVGLSVAFAIDPYRAWWGNQERMNGLFSLLHFLAWLLMATSMIKTWDQWKKLLHYEVVLSVIMALVAIMQKFNPMLLLFQAGPRVGGLLDNPIYMAAYQIFNLFFIALLFWRTKSWNVRAWLLVATFFDLIAFTLTESRGGLVGLFAGIAAFAFFYGLFTKNKKTRFTVLGGLVALFAAYGLLFALRNTELVANSPLARFTDFSSSVTTRLIAWDIAWKGFLERPLTGWGFDDFHILFNLKYNPMSLRFSSYETWFDRSHNTVLDVLAMTGIFGFITFAGIYIALFWSVVKAYRKKWIDLPLASILVGLPVGYFVQNLFVFDHPAAFTMCYLLFAFVIVATRAPFNGEAAMETEKVEPAKDFSWFVSVPVYLVFLLIVWRASLLPFQASRLTILANNYFSANSNQSYEYALKASQIWTPYIDEQTFLHSRNLMTVAAQGSFEKLSKGKEYYALINTLTEELLKRQPMNTHPWYIGARLANEMMRYYPSDAQVAEARYKQAIALSPKRQQLHESYARFLLQTSRSDEALAVLKQNSEFDTEVGEGHWMYGLSLMYDKQQFQAGAKEILMAFSVPYPYQLQDAREYVPYIDAMFLVNDRAAFERFLDALPRYPAATPQILATIAYRLELAGQPDLRDRLFGMSGNNAQVIDQYQKMKLGQASTTSSIQPLPVTSTSTQTVTSAR